MSRLGKELDSFETIWGGGYYEGEPLDPLTNSSYGSLNWISTLYATYLCCIKPYIKHDTIALEIGPGRGCWTKTMLAAKEIYALDALSAEHNGFFEYLDSPANVKYFQVKDFACEMLPENHFDYMFSYGCLCHVSFEGITAYAKSIFPKLRSNANCFWMVADYAKYDQALQAVDHHHLRVLDSLLPHTRIWYIVRSRVAKHLARFEKTQLGGDSNDSPSPGRWYNSGIERTAAMLEDCGYRILDKDIGTNLRDPILHFMKP